ncbi:TetR/AcrR family transcriptional regulator [Variovorax sp. RHLX14]|uniref:TetR/AcrR family transcriptional regulator n=1 Tax=Variovorax sp. RHLX14 TaxID=1259731 RepID=UPI003F44C0B2
MKVTKAKAQANRAHVVETASALFRERGYDGVGVADLMAAAGFTHGGFYKQFGSKTDLMAESAACGIAQTAALSAGVDMSTFVRHYLSRSHRDARAAGCTMAALGADAARQPDAVRTAFAAGIESLLAALEPENVSTDEADAGRRRIDSLDLLAHAVGAIVMSRACPDDSSLADEILAACSDRILASLNPPATTAPSKRTHL